MLRLLTTVALTAAGLTLTPTPAVAGPGSPARAAAVPAAAAAPVAATARPATGLTGARTAQGSSTAPIPQALRSAAAVQARASGAISTTDYNPLAPARLLDTRNGTGAPAAKIGPGATIDVQVTGRGGVPATGVSAVVLTVTATGPTVAGFLAAYPAGTARPAVSTVNFSAGQTISNLALVQVGTAGQVTVYNQLGTTHAVADVTGWYATTGGYHPVTPARVLDTRARNGVPGTAPIAANGTITVTVAGRGGIPATGAVAVALNVTVTGPKAAGDVSVYPAGRARPAASTLNFLAGTTVANLTYAQLGTGGAVSVYNHSAGTSHAVADVAGWFSSGGQYHPMTPERQFDTRTTGTVIRTGQSYDIWPTGFGSVPSLGVNAVVLNVTVVRPTAGGFITVHPYGTALPNSSSLNYTSGRASATMVVAKVGAGGWLRIDNKGGSIGIVVDAIGWYSASGSSGLAVGQSLIATADNAGATLALPQQVPLLGPAAGYRYNGWINNGPLTPLAGPLSMYIRDSLLGITTLVVDGGIAPQIGDLSDDARYLTFATHANNVWPGDVNFADDLFRVDLVANTFDLVSVNRAGTVGDRVSAAAGLSANGRYVQFTSQATNMAPGQSATPSNVFVRDMTARSTVWVDVCVGGDLPCTGQHSVSDDGRYVLYRSSSNTGAIRAQYWDRTTGAKKPLGASSTATTTVGGLAAGAPLASFSTNEALVPADVNRNVDGYVRNLATGALTLVTHTPSGAGDANNASGVAWPSADGQVVPIASTATNLLGTPSPSDQVYVGSATGGPLRLVSRTAAGVPADGFAYQPVASADGAYVRYIAQAPNMGSPPDINPGEWRPIVVVVRVA
jgi:hypothetical protein